MRYEERHPSPDYSPFIERFWAFELETADPLRLDHVIVPDGTVTLSVTQSPGHTGIFLSGPSAMARRVVAERGALYRGVRFRTGALRAFLGIDVAAVTENRVALGDLRADLAAAMISHCVPAEGLAAFGRSFEAVTNGDLARAGECDTAVCGLAERLIADDGASALNRVMNSFGVGARQLRRRFVRETGVTPKLFSRLRRVRRACIDLAYQSHGQIAAISADNGYADQPHFTRELKAVFAMSPHLLQAYLRQIRHMNVGEMARDGIDVRYLQASSDDHC